MDAQSADRALVEIGVERRRRQGGRIEGGAVVLQPDPNGRPQIGQGQRGEVGAPFRAAVTHQIGQPLLHDQLYAVLIMLGAPRILHERSNRSARQLNGRLRGFSHAERQGRRVGWRGVGLCCGEIACHCSE